MCMPNRKIPFNFIVYRILYDINFDLNVIIWRLILFKKGYHKQVLLFFQYFLSATIFILGDKVKIQFIIYFHGKS
jgi:hypothetical protein